MLAEWTGLEPATPGVTGRYSNQLNYHSRFDSLNCQIEQILEPYANKPALTTYKFCKTWRPLGDSNPCSHRERVVS
jgi:hypothetical protein